MGTNHPEMLRCGLFYETVQGYPSSKHMYAGSCAYAAHATRISVHSMALDSRQ